MRAADAERPSDGTSNECADKEKIHYLEVIAYQTPKKYVKLQPKQ